MLRAVLSIIALCLVPLAGATPIKAYYSGCNGTPGTCPGGSFELTAGDGTSSWTFDYSIPNPQLNPITDLDSVVTALEVWDTRNGAKQDTSLKSLAIYLLVGGEDYESASYSLLLDTIGPTTLSAYTNTARDAITETAVNASDLAAFLAALKANNGGFSVEVVDTSGSFNLGGRITGSDGVTSVRYAQLDYQAPEPTTFALAGIGLIAVCWTLRKKIAR